ncbi:MAG: DEAD/DEAH box helicase [Saprospiraceae bacterium]|nr:DEAD/DEAH box helicase [Saprospiraceae bacterium]
MASPLKTRKEILQKLGIEKLNAMQMEAIATIPSHNECVLLSPTGTGKTLAFLIPIIESLDIKCAEVQVLILVPSRELAIQIEQVVREMGTGFKANAVYGGRPFSKDKVDIKHRPALLIGTPGRVADHVRKNTFPVNYLKTLVLDEFDKSLEVGFESDMMEIVASLPKIKSKLLTSATHEVEIPAFLRLRNPTTIDYLDRESSRLKIKSIISPTKDKLKTLGEVLHHLSDQSGIVFCNYKTSIQRVSDYLTEQGIAHGCFYGGMEQIDRERSLIKFRNGTQRILLTTDLAARGIDVPEISFIIHYHLPAHEHEFTHRNGRTARMHADGTAYVLHWEKEVLPDFIPPLTETTFSEPPPTAAPSWTTLFISGGRKDKISKTDIAGFFFKQGKLSNDQLGVIEIKQDCAFVSVAASTVEDLIPLINNQKLKEKKVKVTVL